MRLVDAQLHPYCLPLRWPWVAANATLTQRRGALLQLTDAQGLQGWGDCAPLPSSGAAQHDRVLAALASAAQHVNAIGDPTLPSGAPPEVCWAFDTALADLAAQRRGLTLAAHLGAVNSPSIASIAINAALGPLDAQCISRAAAALKAGYSIGKIKVGVGDPAAEIEHLRNIVAHTGGKLMLRLDANRAWPRDTAAHVLCALSDLPIDAVEEPLTSPTLLALVELQRAVPYALAIDESLPQLGAQALIDAGAVRRFVLKPARLGGIAQTQRVAALAAAAGIDVVLTSVVDSAIGLTACAHLAAALSPKLAHGLGTAAWLAVDVATAPLIVAGRLILPTTPGLGLQPHTPP